MKFGLYRQVDALNSVLKTVLLLKIKFLIRGEARVQFSGEKGRHFQLSFVTGWLTVATTQGSAAACG